MKILISGTSSGLGKYLFEIFEGIPYKRKNPDKKQVTLVNNGVDIIIHTAFNSSNLVNSNNLHTYLKDNVQLTEKLLNIPHKKFIFISTVDVYPKDNKKHREDEVIDINNVGGIYSITKLMSENLVKNLSSDYLILRCTSLLGKYSRSNSLIKIIKENNPTLTVSAESIFNYILYSEVYNFIKLGLKKDLQGIYNLASSENIKLSEVAGIFKKDVNFGNFKYGVGIIDNAKAAVVLPSFKKNSLDVIRQFQLTV